MYLYLYLYAIVLNFVWTFSKTCDMMSGHDANTLKTMDRIAKRIDRLCDKANQHCGHDERVEDFLRYRDKVLQFIAGEIEKGESK